MNVGTHATHCCPVYGCKYGNEDCPVANKTVEAVYACEDCTCARFNPEAAKAANGWWSTLGEDMKTSIYMESLEYSRLKYSDE